MILLDNLFPIFALVILGNRLKHHGLTNAAFLNTTDRLVYFIFFPVMLFWKIGGSGQSFIVDWALCLAAGSAVFTIYILSTLYAVISKVPAYKIGAYSQSCYRFNTYIGMALILTALGEQGVHQFSMLVAFIIPLINTLAVSTLIWYSGQTYTMRYRLRITLKAVILNPLVLGCIAGMLYARLQQPLPTFIANTLRLTSMLTLPLALLSIGGTLTLSGLRGHLSLSLVGALFKLLLLPVTGYLFLNAFEVTGLGYRVAMIFFALPTSTASFVLCSQLNSDTELASATIVLSTLLSFGSLSVALLF